MTTDQLRARIQAACDAAIAKGWRIVEGDWIRRGATNCCCPLGAVVLGVDPNFAMDVLDDPFGDKAFNAAAHALLRTSSWINSFTAAFDGAVDFVRDADAMALGREFREKYKEA